MEQIWAINEISAAHPKRLSVSLLELLHDHKVFIGCSGLHSRRYKHSRDDLSLKERNWMGRCQALKWAGHLCSENHLEQISSNTFHSLEIVKKNAGGKDNHKGDFIIKDDNIEISIEIKCYVNNVPKRELDKLKIDTSSNNCCGILLSNKWNCK